MNNQPTTLKISVSERVNVRDVFVAASKIFKKIVKRVKKILKRLNIRKVVTLTWVPLLARCPADGAYLTCL